MRVIAGRYRSRVLESPRGFSTRPTSDRLRETLFNVLAPRIEGANFADLYAGSGAVGIEALSRGAGFVWFAERDRTALTALRRNLHTLGIGNGYALEDRSTARLLSEVLKAGRRFDIVFLDPPYEAAVEYSSTLGFLAQHHAVVLAPGAVVVAEHRKSPDIGITFGNSRSGQLVRTRLLRQGESALSFFALAEAEPVEDDDEALAA